MNLLRLMVSVGGVYSPARDDYQPARQIARVTWTQQVHVLFDNEVGAFVLV